MLLEMSFASTNVSYLSFPIPCPATSFERFEPSPSPPINATFLMFVLSLVYFVDCKFSKSEENTTLSLLSSPLYREK